MSLGEERVRELRAGDFLFRQGDTATAVFSIERGRLRLERRTYDGRLVPLHTARAGETFAEAALFAESYHCDAVALEDACVRVHPKTNLIEQLGGETAQAAPFLKAMALQLHALRQRLELRNVRSARDRVLLALELRVTDESLTVNLDGPLQDLAADLGLTREALYRTLSALEREGRLARDGTRVVLKRPLGSA